MADNESVDKPCAQHSEDDPPAPSVRDGVLINEIQLLLAEKRTYLAFLRTGIAILALPLSLISFLIATSQQYRVIQVWPLLVPLLWACAALAVFGIMMIRTAVQKIRHADDLIRKLKEKNTVIAEFIE